MSGASERLRSGHGVSQWAKHDANGRTPTYTPKYPLFSVIENYVSTHGVKEDI